MPLPYLAIALFGLAALILIWLGRYTHRDAPQSGSPISVGMTEAEVLGVLGPPEEVRRDGDPLDSGSFVGGTHSSYVYPGFGVVRFIDGVVQEIGAETPLPSRPAPAGHGILFRRNSQSGALEAVQRQGVGVELNAALHAN